MPSNGIKYIVRQPIKDMNGKIMAYEIRYAGENNAYEIEGQDFAAADTIYTFLTQNSSKALKDTLSFMTFPSNLLMRQTPKLFNPDALVIQIDDSVIIHPLAMRFVERFSSDGYKIAVNEFQFSPRYFSLLDKVDFIKINFQATADTSIRNTVDMAHSMGKQCIATQVDNEELYQKAFVMGVDAMEGQYVADQMRTTVHSSAYLQSSFFRLMVAVTVDEPDVEEIERIISTDATLTYALLKIVNSAYFALRNRATDVHQAVMVLGIGQLRQWIYLMGEGNAAGDVDPNQEEFLRTSFMRATFCSELMKMAKKLPITRNDAYLMGMFSTLNHLIAAPMEEILAEIPMAKPVKEALLTQEGPCGALYKLVLSYERADWSAIGRLAEELHIPIDRLTNTYFQCLDEVNNIWQQLMSMQEFDEEPKEA